MFARYAYKAGAAAANIISDVCKILAGAALADLSADCDAAASLLYGCAAGWRIDDATYGVVSAPCLGGGRKVFRILPRTKNSIPGISAVPVESWDSAAHAGVNVCTLDDAYVTGYPSINSTAAGVLLIGASEAGAIINDTGDKVMALLGEIENGAPSVIVRACAFYSGGNLIGWNPRMKKFDGAGETKNAKLALSVSSRGYPSKLLGVGEVYYYEATDIVVSYYGAALALGRLRGFKWMPSNEVSISDVLLDSAGGRYVAFSAYSSNIVGLNCG